MLKQFPAEVALQPVRSKAESKASVTDAAARQIIDSEAAKREAKTAKLRAARLAMEAQQATEEVVAVKKPAKATKAKAAKR